MNNNTMHKLAELSRQKLDHAGRELVQLQALCRQAEEKLSLLESYRQEYQSRLRQRSLQGVHSTHLLEYQRFLKQLEEVIQLQSREVERHRRFCHEAMQRWLAVRREMKGYEKLGERREAELHVAALKKSQKEMDEFSNRVRGVLSKLV